jgi:NAD(P)-dependent dehydrogenase (short-subunit alcohol dehydrogenase family)
MAEKWTAEEIPSQAGRTAVITGANSGLGLEAARALAMAGADVVLACRNTDKGREAAESIHEDAPSASVAKLDLADLDSVRGFAERFATQRDGLDLLINNAGVMAASPRQQTADGFELQFGTNHLGPFALTGLLLERMQGREDARVVTVSSTAHRYGKVRFGDLQGERRYRRWRAYCQSKLANVLFARELDRRLREAGSTVSSLAAHPGYAATNLQTAATRPNLDGGLMIGPDGFDEQRGYPRVVGPAKRGRDGAAAAQLWKVSEELTGVSYEFGS